MAHQLEPLEFLGLRPISSVFCRFIESTQKEGSAVCAPCPSPHGWYCAALSGLRRASLPSRVVARVLDVCVFMSVRIHVYT